jgi:hypothetical protein
MIESSSRGGYASKPHIVIRIFRVALFSVATMPTVACPIASVSGAACDLRIIEPLNVEGMQIHRPSQWLAIADIPVIASSRVRGRPTATERGWAQRASRSWPRRGSSAKHAALQLSRFPDAAIYSGSGYINDAEYWNCSENQELLQNRPKRTRGRFGQRRVSLEGSTASRQFWARFYARHAGQSG